MMRRFYDTVISNCYQESPQFAHAQNLDRKTCTARVGLENAAENINCPDMNEVSRISGGILKGVVGDDQRCGAGISARRRND